MKKKSLTDIDIHLPVKGNEYLEKALNIINRNIEVRTLWKIINVNAIDRLSMSDHGIVHYQLVANIALKLCRLLRESGVEMSIVKNFNLTDNHAELVVLLASLLHDLGMSIHRAEHEEYSLFLTNNILREILSFLSVEEKTIIISETLHAIISHRSDGLPFTVEAGIVRVADALDMTEGRSRIPYEEGKIDIYSVSATAIDNIKIQKGQDEPISIKIFMNNSAGIFQVDQLFREKLQGSGLEKYIIVEAIIESEQEKKLLKKYTL
jgi:hypothetical protein